VYQMMVAYHWWVDDCNNVPKWCIYGARHQDPQKYR
jgi:hypothetical protein